ncbi:hypothetical protein, partial [Rhodococcoides kroppenstedtii]|uniref:hypothetical protein n=1 Tax=Rhodococcoides kroppenstedtii TaxID=293050 RepID=UPI001BDE3FC1
MNRREPARTVVAVQAVFRNLGRTRLDDSRRSRNEKVKSSIPQGGSKTYAEQRLCDSHDRF